MKFNSNLSNLLFLIDSAIIEFELLHQDVIVYDPPNKNLQSSTEEFTLQAIRCLVRDADLVLTNKYYIIITDEFGPHCIDFVITFDHVLERFEYWKRFIGLGRRKVVEYSFPDIFPIREWELNRGKNGKNEKNQ